MNIIEYYLTASMPLRVKNTLEKYKNNDNIFITFTSIAKVGINVNYSFQTPLGIYCYPLKWIWPLIKNKGFAKGTKFGSDRKYLYVLNGNRSGKKLVDLQKYNSFEYDLIKLKKMKYLSKYMSNESWIYFEKYDLKNIRKAYTSQGELLWGTTQQIAKYWINEQRGPFYWNYLLKKLGYLGFKDKQSIIHPNEPIQAVFFSKKGFKIVDKTYNSIPNVSYKKLSVNVLVIVNSELKKYKKELKSLYALSDEEVEREIGYDAYDSEIDYFNNLIVFCENVIEWIENKQVYKIKDYMDEEYEYQSLGQESILDYIDWIEDKSFKLLLKHFSTK
jgi:hypothetical protein